MQPSPRQTLLKLNIGGSSYIVLTEAAINCERNGLLSRFAQLPHRKRVHVADSYLAESQEYFFQRSPALFEPIFQFYTTGVIHKPPEMCPEAFLTEMKFWGIPFEHIGSCCAEEIPQEKPVVKEDERDYFEGIDDFGKFESQIARILAVIK